MDEKLYKNYRVSYKINVERKMKDGGYSRFCDQDLLTLECNEATEPYLEMKFARPDFKYRIPQWVKIEE